MVIKFDFRHRPIDGDALLTMACPVGCSFCIYSCMPSKEDWKWMPEGTIERVAEEYSKNNIGIRICGGEPFYDLPRLEKCIDILSKYYKQEEILIISSAFFAKNQKETRKNLEILKEKSIDTLIVSIDRFHMKTVPLEFIRNAALISEKMGIELVLRMSLDIASSSLVDKVTDITLKYGALIEVHEWGSFGRGEKIDQSPLRNFSTVTEYLAKEIKQKAKKYKKPDDIKYYLTHSSKRSQRFYLAEFFPTTFPNGNVYGCSICGNLSFMGNINDENLFDMIKRWKQTLPGHYMMTHGGCNYLSNLLPPKYASDRCDFCKNQPFGRDNLSESIGRKFVKITTDMDLGELVKQFRRWNREYLISFRLSEKDLWNKESGKEIQEFLKKLDSNGINYTLSRPLPKCLGVITGGKEPKNCFECREMFTANNGTINFCDPFNNATGPKLSQIRNRQDIFEHFKKIHDSRKIPNICKTCIYFKRGQCNSLCFVSPEKS